MLDRLLHGRQQLLQCNRLLEEIEGAEAGSLDRRIDRPVSGHHHDRHVEMACGVPLLEQRDAVGIGHPDVEQHKVRAHLATYPPRRGGMLGQADIVSLVDKYLGEQLADADLIINDQND